MNQVVKTHEEAYVITGPTSGIGLQAALELAQHATVILVGRDRLKLASVQKKIEARGQKARSIVCDLSELSSVRHAASEILALEFSLIGVLNNAGIMQTRPTKNSAGWDLSFATNHIGPFVLTESLLPSLPNGARVLFVTSAVEDPGRKPAVAAGFRGGRYLSAAASSTGEWAPGGSQKPGFDAYATSKQAGLATALAFARENPRLCISAVEPGFNPSTGLGGADAGATIRLIQKYLVPLLVPFLKPFISILSTSKQAGKILTKILTDRQAPSGIYYDERGRPMKGSATVSDPVFQDRIVAETRALLGLNVPKT